MNDLAKISRRIKFMGFMSLELEKLVPYSIDYEDLENKINTLENCWLTIQKFNDSINNEKLI